MDLNVDSLETPVLTKAHLAEQLHQKIGFNKRESQEITDKLFDIVAHKLLSAEEIKLSGFGNFQVRAKNARPGRNPRTGESVTIAPRSVVTFHASNKLKTHIEAA
jgi:integration host factor subunit alpha